MQEVVDSQDLINTISKLEKLEEEKRELADVTQDAYNEAKSKGYDVSAPRKVRKIQSVRIRPMQRLTTSIEATIVLQEVTNVMKPVEAT